MFTSLKRDIALTVYLSLRDGQINAHGTTEQISIKLQALWKLGVGVRGENVQNCR